MKKNQTENQQEFPDFTNRHTAYVPLRDAMSPSRWKERFKRKHPNEHITDERKAKEIFYNDYDSMEQENIKFLEDNDKLIRAIQDHPEANIFLAELTAGVPLKVALARAEIDIYEPEEGDEDFEEYIKAYNERKNNLVMAKKKEQQYIENFSKSKVDIASFFDSHNLNLQEQQEFEEFIDDTISNLFNGLINKEILSKLHQAWKYEEHVQQAKETGELNGRNANIEAQREQRHRQVDGLANSGVRSNTPEPTHQIDYIDKLIKGRR